MKIRRVVTGHNETGQSVVKWDTHIEIRPRRPGLEQAVLWATPSLPVEFTEEDPATRELGITLPGGSVFRVVCYQPGVGQNWHRTETIDYAVVLSGELWLQLDEEEVHVRTGDVIIQRGTLHNWDNRSREACWMAFVLIATR